MSPDQTPKQSRSIATERKLLDALVKLLAQKSFNDLTVAELAEEAGVTTGAIYRRFADKEDVLQTAFERLIAERTGLYNSTYPEDLSDRDLLKAYFKNLMEFVIGNAALMRAANGLNNQESFEHLVRARAETAKWMSNRIRNSPLPDRAKEDRVRMVLRVVTATFRDTFLSGRASAAIENDGAERSEHERRLDRLCSNLADMASSYLELPPEDPPS